jgi:hypothetical protein
MFSLLGAAGLGSLAGLGLLTNLCVVGRGVVRATRAAAKKNFADAAVTVLGAVSTPFLIAAASLTALAGEVLEGACDLARPATEEPDLPGRRAA